MTEIVVNYLNAAFPYGPEYLNLGMALEGALAVKRGVNKEGKLYWFHALLLSIVMAFGGGIFTKTWIAQPSAFLSNGDLCMGCCLIAFVLVNFAPFFHTLCDTSKYMPLNLIITSAAQLFRSTAIPLYVNTAFAIFKPSAYYPIPVFGPILYATLLGNMGPLFLKGFERHIENEIPWPVQNGLFCASFYHFYVNDQEGPIGQLLRTLFPVGSLLGLEDARCAAALVSLFMQITGFLRLPEFWGPTYSPFAPFIPSKNDSKSAKSIFPHYLISLFSSLGRKATPTTTITTIPTTTVAVATQKAAAATKAPESSAPVLQREEDTTTNETKSKKKKKKKNNNSAATSSTTEAATANGPATIEAKKDR